MKTDNDIDLLYIEDNEDYVDMVGRLVKKVDTTIKYEFITDGQKAKDILVPESKGIMKKPKLILLDYNLPGVSGIELLKYIRSYSDLKHTPVVIFSSSDNPQDIDAAYKSGANAYIVKPIGLNNLKETLQVLFDFWIRKNCRPFNN